MILHFFVDFQILVIAACSAQWADSEDYNDEGVEDFSEEYDFGVEYIDTSSSTTPSPITSSSTPPPTIQTAIRPSFAPLPESEKKPEPKTPDFNVVDSIPDSDEDASPANEVSYLTFFPFPIPCLSHFNLTHHNLVLFLIRVPLFRFQVQVHFPSLHFHTKDQSDLTFFYGGSNTSTSSVLASFMQPWILIVFAVTALVVVLFCVLVYSCGRCARQ